jgi:thioesterase domain-containing protein
MVKILLDHADGQYSTKLLSEEEATELEAQGLAVAYVQDAVYDAYLRHCDQDAGYQALWRSIANEQYIRRRERELLPLEEAQREIDRLREELARSERLHRHYEDEWLRATGRQTRAEHNNDGAYTCIYPQPNCDIDALESAEWRLRAQEILNKYNVALGEEGSRHQGCCCGHTHRLLSDQTAKELRAAGFLIENEADPDDSELPTP